MNIYVYITYLGQQMKTIKITSYIIWIIAGLAGGIFVYLYSDLNHYSSKYCEVQEGWRGLPPPPKHPPEPVAPPEPAASPAPVYTTIVNDFVQFPPHGISAIPLLVLSGKMSSDGDHETSTSINNSDKYLVSRIQNVINHTIDASATIWTDSDYKKMGQYYNTYTDSVDPPGGAPPIPPAEFAFGSKENNYYNNRIREIVELQLSKPVTETNSSWSFTNQYYNRQLA